MLGADERLDVRMIAAQCRHHGAAAGAGRRDGCADHVKDADECNRPGGETVGGARRGAARPQGREIQANAATLLQRQSCFACRIEYTDQRVVDATHDKTVRQRDAGGHAGTGQDTSARQKAAACQRGHEFRDAPLRLLVHGRGRARDALPAVTDVSFGSACAVPRAPDVIGEAAECLGWAGTLFRREFA